MSTDFESPAHAPGFLFAAVAFAPIDRPTVSARLHAPNPRPERDALIAATAALQGMTVVTRNTGDFGGLGVTVLNPWT